MPGIAQAGAQLAVLAEMATDDAATRRHDPGELAEALVVLARASARTRALHATWAVDSSLARGVAARAAHERAGARGLAE
jgi:hypothetical protein